MIVFPLFKGLPFFSGGGVIDWLTLRLKFGSVDI